MNTLLNWIPAIILLVIYVLFLVRLRGGPMKLQAEILEEQRRQIQVLERIAAALERGGA